MREDILYQLAPEDFGVADSARINFEKILEYNRFPFKFLEKYKNYIKREWLLTYQDIPEIYIDQFFNTFTEEQKDLIIRNQILSEKFIRKHMDELNMNKVIVNQSLSADFINDNKKKFKSDLVLLSQNPINDKFINNKSNFKYLAKYHRLSESIIAKYLNYFDLKLVSDYQYNLSSIFRESFYLPRNKDLFVYKSNEHKKVEIEKLGFRCNNEIAIGFIITGAHSDPLVLRKHYRPNDIITSFADCVNGNFGIKVNTSKETKGITANTVKWMVEVPFENIIYIKDNTLIVDRVKLLTTTSV